MKTTTFSQQGKRPYQEDTLYSNPEKGLFIICDGVGGAAKGDVASNLVVQTIREMVEDKNILPTGKAMVHQLITAASSALHQRVLEYPEEEGMGTTLTMLFFHNEGATLAHIGDSRIYYLKPNDKKYWRTNDHSLVQELFDSGILKNEEDMEVHPQRNRITRALQGKKEMVPVKAAVMLLDHLEAGDVFFLCSDGVLEPYSKDSIVEILANNTKSLTDRLDAIKSDCSEISKDNNTAILLELETKDAITAGKNDQIAWRSLTTRSLIAATPAVASAAPEPVPMSAKESSTPPTESKETTAKPGNQLTFWKIALLTFFVLAVGGYFLCGDRGEPTLTETDQKPAANQTGLGQIVDNSGRHKPKPKPAPDAKPSVPTPSVYDDESPASEEAEAATLAEDVPESSDPTPEPAYEQTITLSDNLVAAKKGGKWGFIDKNGKIILDFKYNNTPELSDGMIAVSDGKGWGFVNDSGKEIVELKYANANKFSQGQACVQIKSGENKGKWMFIDKKGGNAFHPQKHFFDEGATFKDGKAIVKQGGKTYELGTKGGMKEIKS